MTDEVVVRAEGLGRRVALPDGSALDILLDVDLSVNRGETVAVCGPSGSGKSTLLNLLGFLDTPTSGRVEILGRAADSLSEQQRAELRGEAIGFVFQSFHLLDRRTAVENVLTPLVVGTALTRRARRRRAEELLVALGLGDRLESMPSVLSGGEQQRVAIARSLVRDPAVVLADEPTGALDVATGDAVLDMLFAQVRERGCGMVVVTHDPRVAGRADRIVELATHSTVVRPASDGAGEQPT